MGTIYFISLKTKRNSVQDGFPFYHSSWNVFHFMRLVFVYLCLKVKTKYRLLPSTFCSTIAEF